MGRISKIEYIKGLVELNEKRSTCERANVGAVALIDGRPLLSGYNGAPSGEPHCSEIGCDIENGGCIRTVHAEANLVAMAARVGISLAGSRIYCTYSPCLVCARLLLNVDISGFYYFKKYRDERGLELLFDHGIDLKYYDHI